MTTLKVKTFCIRDAATKERLYAGSFFTEKDAAKKAKKIAKKLKGSAPIVVLND